MPTKISAVDALLDGAAAPAPVQVKAAPPVADEFKPPLPKTKGEVGKLSSEQMDMLVEAHGVEVGNAWSDASGAEKQKLLNVALGFVAAKGAKKAAKSTAVVTEPSAPVEEVQAADVNVLDYDPEDDAPSTELVKPTLQAHLVDPNDPLAKAAQEIENLSDQGEIELELKARLTNSGMDRFYLGGLLLRLLAVGAFPDNNSFKEYIGTKWGLKYRSARNYITLYTGLLNSGVSWATVSEIGWTKTVTLLPVLTPENAGEWVEKAKAYNTDTLHAAVQQMEASGQVGDGATVAPDTTLQSSKLKTLTFMAAPDQEEIINEAIKDAQSKSGTEHKGVALELICTEYLGNTGGMKPKAATTFEPKAIFSHFMAKAGGDRAQALAMLFDDSFDEVIPGVEVSFNIA